MYGVPGHCPSDDGGDRNSKHDRHKDSGNAIGEALNRSSGTLSVFNKLHDLSERSVISNACRFDNKVAVRIHCCADNIVARANFNWHWFARDHRHVDSGMALDHGSIGGDLLAGPHNKPNANNKFLERNFGPVFETCSFHTEFRKFAQRVAGTPTCSRFEPLA